MKKTQKIKNQNPENLTNQIELNKSNINSITVTGNLRYLRRVKASTILNLGT
jgi:hypothetical protein